MEDRHCENCGELLVRRHGEPPRDFRRRKFCNRQCAGSFHIRKRKGDATTVAAAVEKAASADPHEHKTGRQILSEIANDVSRDIYVRVTAAKALLPYEEAKPGATGKKQQKATAAKDVLDSGKFAPMPFPTLVKGGR